jgi:hypothetical protein
MIPIDSHSVGSALGIANSAISAAKSAYELVKKTSDIELKHQVSDVMNSILDLKVKILELDEENRQLRQRLEQRDNIKRESESGFWLKDGETDPLCPTCYEGPSHAIVYLKAKYYSAELRRTTRFCHVCHSSFTCK